MTLVRIARLIRPAMVLLATVAVGEPVEPWQRPLSLRIFEQARDE